MSIRLACSASSFPADRLEIAIAKAAWAGYEGVELTLAEEPFPEEEEVRRRLTANELELVAVRAGALPAADGDASLEALGRIGRAAVLARALDCPLLILEAPETGTPSGLARSLGLLAGALAHVAVELCIVNRRDTVLADPEALQALWEQGPPAGLGLALDPAEALLAGWDPHDLDALPVLPRHVYLDDAGGDRVVPPGEGRLDLPRLAAQLSDSGYAGWLSLRLENADPWAVEPVAKEIREWAVDWLDAA